MHQEGRTRPTGRLSLVKMPTAWPTDPSTREIARHGLPGRDLPEEVSLWRLANLRNLVRGWRQLAGARLSGSVHCYGALYLDLLRADGSRVPLGLASLRVVTTAGVNFIRDAFLNTTELENMKFHGFGVGTNAEAIGDTALQTEETTQYVTDNTRPTGSQVSQGTGIYRTVGTYSPDSGTSPRPITEHGIFSQAATGGGTLLDRSVFSVVNLVTNADSLQATYDFTVTSGG
jgi:hypothetical protein